jgi:NAD(P)-dependent dehydrogenase (short-subunit alcohol dehydrogenase family)
MTAQATAETSAGTVLVTGAAGGIGVAVVEALHRDRYRVVGLDRKDPPRNLEIEWIRHDLRDLGGTEALLSQSPLLADLTHAVSVAGGAIDDEVGLLDPAEVPIDIFKASVELNLVAQYAVVRAASARMVNGHPDNDRSITLFSSINALRGYGMPGYSAAKAGLLGLVVALALPLGRRGVRINAVVPGTVLTERFRETYPPSSEVSPRLVETTASGRPTQPEDVARAVSAVIRLRQMTGQHLIIDGGQLAVPFDQYPLA